MNYINTTNIDLTRSKGCGGYEEKISSCVVKGEREGEMERQDSKECGMEGFLGEYADWMRDLAEGGGRNPGQHSHTTL